MGVDLRTYNMLIDLQHRDITPEDYEVLRQLDSKVKPKTLPRCRLEEAAPSLRVPSPTDDEPEAAPLRNLRERACCICLDTFVSGDIVRVLPCRHVFHAGCIDEWLTESSHRCPEDALPVLPDDDK